jgi:hypothetical protein
MLMVIDVIGNELEDGARSESPPTVSRRDP